MDLKTIKFDPSRDLIFDLKVREMCKTCKRYNKKASCPPYIESVEYYQNLLPTYQNGIIYFGTFSIDGDAKDLGEKSSLRIYQAVMDERNRLFQAGHYLIVGFGAGSCKICVTCSFPCHSPDKALIPLEATGVDVIKTMKNLNIDVRFPVEKTGELYRIGAVLYD